MFRSASGGLPLNYQSYREARDRSRSPISHRQHRSVSPDDEYGQRASRRSRYMPARQRRREEEDSEKSLHSMAPVVSRATGPMVGTENASKAVLEQANRFRQAAVDNNIAEVRRCAREILESGNPVSLSAWVLEDVLEKAGAEYCLLGYLVSGFDLMKHGCSDMNIMLSSLSDFYDIYKDVLDPDTIGYFRLRDCYILRRVLAMTLIMRQYLQLQIDDAQRQEFYFIYPVQREKFFSCYTLDRAGADNVMAHLDSAVKLMGGMLGKNGKEAGAEILTTMQSVPVDGYPESMLRTEHAWNWYCRSQEGLAQKSIDTLGGLCTQLDSLGS